MKLLNCAVYFLSFCFFSLSCVSAADLDREKRMADEIVDAILDGEAIFLKANDHEFLSIYTEASESSEAARGTAIIHCSWQVIPSSRSLVSSRAGALCLHKGP